MKTSWNPTIFMIVKQDDAIVQEELYNIFTEKTSIFSFLIFCKYFISYNKCLYFYVVVKAKPNTEECTLRYFGEKRIKYTICNVLSPMYHISLKFYRFALNIC